MYIGAQTDIYGGNELDCSWKIKRGGTSANELVGSILANTICLPEMADFGLNPELTLGLTSELKFDCSPSSN